MSELRIEHYKTLKEEHRQYMMQIQQLWLYKLSTLGAVIAFAIFSDKIVGIGSFKKETIIACGLIALPILSMLIDLKVLEFSLHIKAISTHFIQKYSDIAEIYEWEKNLWAGGAYSKLRTWLTIIGAVGISISILLIAFVFAYFIKPDWKYGLFIFGVILVCLPLITALKTLPKLLK